MSRASDAASAPAHRARRQRGRQRLALGLLAPLASAALVACSGDDAGSDGTLSAIPDGSGGTNTTPPSGTVSSSQATSGGDVDPGAAGSGFVTISVQLAAEGVTETLSLDRASVRADQLDPVSLNAVCTSLDGGDLGQGLDVAVVDLRRLAGSRLVSASLHVTGDAAAGEHPVTLEVSTADQATKTYSGTVTLADGSASGTFETADAGGGAATGSFACAAEPIPTTVPPEVTGGGEEVPETSTPTS